MGWSTLILLLKSFEKISCALVGVCGWSGCLLKSGEEVLAMSLKVC